MVLKIFLKAVTKKLTVYIYIYILFCIKEEFFMKSKLHIFSCFLSALLTCAMCISVAQPNVVMAKTVKAQTKTEKEIGRAHV